MIQINPYLQRIEYQGDLTPCLILLNQLQRAHLLSVPFENLDIHLPEEIRLDVERIFQKVVHRRRGGFCYELNGLFHFLLVELGFEVKRISASVLGSKGLWGPEYDHLVNLVFLDEQWWLTDVGFGDFPFVPIPLTHQAEVEDRNQRFWVEQLDAKAWMLKKRGPDGQEVEKYRFTTIQREYEEFAGMCHYHQTSPDSHFTQNKICTICTPDGRITLSRNKLVILEEENRLEKEIKGQKEFDQYLWEYFQMRL